MLYHPQIIQTKGSYSFLLCGMIIACVGFILFIGLLLFHRMHRNYLAGTLSDSTLIHCCWTFSYYYSFITHPPPFQLHLHPNRNNKKICHGGGTNCRAEWIFPHRTERGEHEQLRAAAPDFCPLLASVGYEQYVSQDLRHLTIAAKWTLCIYSDGFGSVFHFILLLGLNVKRTMITCRLLYNLFCLIRVRVRFNVFFCISFG